MENVNVRSSKISGKDKLIIVLLFLVVIGLFSTFANAQRTSNVSVESIAENEAFALVLQETFTVQEPVIAVEEETVDDIEKLHFSNHVQSSVSETSNTVAETIAEVEAEIATQSAPVQPNSTHNTNHNNRTNHNNNENHNNGTNHNNNANHNNNSGHGGNKH